MKYIYIIPCATILLVSLFISCTKSNRKTSNAFKDVKTETFEKNVKELELSNNDNYIKINIPNVANDENLNLSSIVDSISYIKLSNDPKAIIGVIDKIEFSDTHIYILDRYKTKTLKVFDNKGSFITQIGKRGEGPEEYNEITDFVILEKNIILYDQFKQRMMIFNKCGKLLTTKKIPFTLLKFYCFTTDKYVFNTLDCDNDHLQSIVNNSIFESDSNFVLSHRGFYRKKGLYSSEFKETDFSYKENKVYYHPPYSDTIYSISKTNTIKVECVFDLGKRKLPRYYLLDKNHEEFLKECNENNYIFLSGNYYSMDDFIYFEFSKRNSLYRGVFSKVTKKLSIGNNILNDVSTIFNFQNILLSQKNTLVGYTQAQDILINLPKDRSLWPMYIGKKNALVMDKMSFEDNPILLFYHLKKNK